MAELQALLDAGDVRWPGVRLQGVDLTGHAHAFDGATDLRGLVVLGGALPTDLAGRLRDRGAVVFPPLPDAPVDPYRGLLYTPDELCRGLEQRGYHATPDAVAYEWSRRPGHMRDAYAAVMQSLHDTSISDALDETLHGRRVVGVMGGPAVARGAAEFTRAAHLGHRLAESGTVVLTGGGPGAMEASNLGAFCTDTASLERALGELARVPSFVPDIDKWARLALDVRQNLAAHRTDDAIRTIGIPTWFYGHEPPNVFVDGVAKFFSNALRENGLLAHARDGIIVLPGAAGTVQEIFQAVTPRYYVGAQTTPPPLVLVGERHWIDDLPAWPLVEALGRDRAMAQAVHLVDSLDEAAKVIGLQGSACRQRRRQTKTRPSSGMRAR